MIIDKVIDNKLLMDFIKKTRDEGLEAGQFFLEEFYRGLCKTPDQQLTIQELYSIINICQKLCIVHNDKIIECLKNIRISKNTLQWFVNAESIFNELELLKKTGIIDFSKIAFFSAILFHLQIKVAVNVIEDLGLVETYNNKSEFNFLRKIFYNYFRRRKYYDKRGSALLKTNEEIKMDFLMNNLATLIPRENVPEKLLRDLSRGDTFYFLQSLNEFEIVSGTKSDAYLAMFDLISLVVKDKELLKEGDYLNEGGYRNYEDYKITRVKRILTQS